MMVSFVHVLTSVYSSRMGSGLLFMSMTYIIVVADKKSDVEGVFAVLENQFGEMTKTIGPEFTYLGMNVKVKGKVAEIDMDNYVQKILDMWQPKREYTVPADPDLFSVDSASELLSEQDRKRFHTMVAKLLYLAKRVRPDLLPAVTFLTTRVSCATKEDWKKLERVIGYLKKFDDLKMYLSGSSPAMLELWVDVAFGVHFDGKSHTGIRFSLGRGSIYFASMKQKTVARSSWEGEINGVSDAGPAVLWTITLNEDLGFQCRPAVLYQDNQAAIASLRTGEVHGKMSKHIKIRELWVIEKLENGDIVIVWKRTDEMDADFFSKAVTGQQFVKLSKRIRGEA